MAARPAGCKFAPGPRSWCPDRTSGAIRHPTKTPGHGPGDPVSCGGIRSNPTACARGIGVVGLLVPCSLIRPGFTTGVSQDPTLYSSRPGSRSIWRRRLTGRRPSSESCKYRSLRLTAPQIVANDCERVVGRRTRAIFACPFVDFAASGCGALRPLWCETSRWGFVPAGTRFASGRPGRQARRGLRGRAPRWRRPCA